MRDKNRDRKKKITFFQRESGELDGDTVSDRENKNGMKSEREKRERIKAETKRKGLKERMRVWEMELKQVIIKERRG